MSSKAQISVALAAVILSVHEAAAQATVTSTQTVSVPTARPTNAFNVPADFPSVGFETAFLDGYDNDFSDNLVASLASRMAEPPIVRVGGTSGDIITYNPDQEEAAICTDDVCNSASTFILGKSYFNAMSRFQSARFSIQAPLTDGNPNSTNIIDYIQRAYNALGADRVDAIALGNEVNWYEDDGPSYVADAQAAKDAINSVLDLGTEPIWEILDTASEDASTGGAPYTVQGVFDNGINSDNKVKYVAEHYYQWDGKTSGITEQLLNHTAMMKKINQYVDDIAYTRNTAGAEFILSETGGPLGVSEDEQTFFANTLWSINFQLYAMSIGVSRVTGVQRPEARRSLWIPESGLAVPGPRVQAPFYALPFIADFIGKDVSGDRGAFHINLYTPFVTAYAMYEGSKITRVAIVNLRKYAGEDTRNAVKLHFQGLGSATQAKVGRMHADEGINAGGFDVNGLNITWAGQDWSYQVDQGSGHGTVEMKTLAVTDGAVDVVIPDSEALMIYVS
jgi:hypothetical protein